MKTEWYRYVRVQYGASSEYKEVDNEKYLAVAVVSSLSFSLSFAKSC
jgi:hypothetical protein